MKFFLKYDYEQVVLSFFFFWFCFTALLAQTKVSGIVLDKMNQPVPFANVVFKNSNQGVMSNEDGRFYLESLNRTLYYCNLRRFSDTEVPLTNLSIMILRYY
jgi:hypothetical protein